MIDFEDSGPAEDAGETILKTWRSKFAAGDLQSPDIVKFLQTSAPNFLELKTTSETVRCSFNESGAKAAIIDILEEFILGDNPQNVLEKLSLEGNAPAVCGRVFKIGEPTYSCRECGLDGTCVLCVSCFKLSAHRYHKYKMSTSSGGGCCDCGDTEAWKKDQYCEEHIRGKEIKKDSSIITDRMKERCNIAFNALLSYCVKFLEMESYASFECLDNECDDMYYCTILYNDESHTFEQVIHTLIKIVKCSQKDAMEIVTSIDREGRAVVKCDVFENCAKLKEAIENQPSQYASATRSSPLKVSLLHRKAVSCQQFALQLLSWFQEFLTRHVIFREIFATVATDPEKRSYNIGHILEYDVKLWKTARSCWHRLLLSGMLMEYENKKMLAIEFSKHYATIIQDFIRDDHEHSISIVSLSVQLFTVPTIAYHLMANEGIFNKLMHTFYYETIKKYVQNETLHFAKNMINLNIFKRSSFILFDVKYILNFKPDTWTPGLREGFLDGVKVLLKMLSSMQGMDAVFRQTGQHMDYEPEWESAFNLHIKLASVISLVLEWASTDREAIMKVYQMTMRSLVENNFLVGTTQVSEQKYAGHIAQCIMNDVSTKLVSIHLPLSRFYAGLYLNLEKFNLNYDYFGSPGKRNPEEIIEPVLCTQAMIAQVHAGMWRRNGYSLLHQLYFYRNVRCRTEMLDRDIQLLQIGAALIESNRFLIHILNKFHLLEWAQPNFEPTSQSSSDDDFVRMLNMIDEYLELLIVIIGERYVPGISDVTADDRITKEIVQQLCIKNFSHSELSRALPDDDNVHNLEDIIDAIATFKIPSQSDSKGVYELKEEYYEWYNMYYYHYTKEDKSKSEEFQRSRRKAKKQLVCCPPPKLPKLASGFVSIANLLQCDVMLNIMVVVLTRALDLTAKSFSESHLQKVLHLIGYGLQEEQSGHYPFLTFYRRAMDFNILNYLEQLSHNPRVEAHRDFIIWTIKKFKELQPKESNAEAMDSDPINEPMTAAEAEKKEKLERAKLAAERRAQIMAEIAIQQKSFINSNAELFANTNTSSTSNENMDWQETEPEPELEAEAPDQSKPIACLGLDRQLPQIAEFRVKCILCFEPCKNTVDGHCLVSPAFVQKSKVLLAPSQEFNWFPHTSTCGHVIHAHCWKRYYETEILKENRRPNRNRSPNSFVAEKKEFLCPYCRCFSNCVLPLTPPLSQISPPSIIKSGQRILQFDIWLLIMRKYLDELYVIEKTNVYSNNSAEYQPKFPDINGISLAHLNENEFELISPPLDDVKVQEDWLTFAEAYMSILQIISPYPHSAQVAEPYLVLWNTCAYTIQSLEMYLRAVDKPLKNELSARHTSCLTGLVRFCGLRGSAVETAVADKLMIHLRGVLETVLKQRGPSIVEWDIFNMMTSMIFLTPAVMYAHDDAHVVPSGNLLEYYFLQLMFCANIAKAMVLYHSDDAAVIKLEKRKPSEHFDKNFGNMRILYDRYNIQSRSGKRTLDLGVRGMRKLMVFIKNESMTFLRNCCLLFHFMTDVNFPEEFNESSGATFENMCKYLGLHPEIEYYFDFKGQHSPLIEHFSSHPDILYYDHATFSKRNGQQFEIIPCVTSVRELVKLPEDYSDLINSVSDYTCPNNDREESKNPTMCLICGMVVCGQSYCCQPQLGSVHIGATTFHAHMCGAGIGLFLRIRDCQILCLGQYKGCFLPPPYLDKYGETDQGLRRGNPLRLCPERYRKLHLMWLGHGLHEEIARLNENANTVIATQWQHM